MTLDTTHAALSLPALLRLTRTALSPERAARVWSTATGGDEPLLGGELLAAALGRLIDACFDAQLDPSTGIRTGATHVVVHAERTRSGLDLTVLSRPPVRTESPARTAALDELRRLGAFLAERETSAGEHCTFVRVPAISALGDAA